MANLGELTEIINSHEVTLDVGSDSYIMVTNIDFDYVRPESRDPTAGGTPVYSYGQGDISFTATLLATTPELTSLNTLAELDANGDMTSTAWKIVYTDISGTTRTFAATGFLNEYHISRPAEGKVKITIRVRVNGDTITVS